MANGLAQDPLAWGLVLALGAVVYLYRQNEALRAKAIADMQAANDKLLVTVREDAASQRALLEQVIPLAMKLTEGIEALERVVELIPEENR